MKKKIFLLSALYYISIIVSSCCNERFFFEISFKETEVTKVIDATKPYYLISPINPKEESGFMSGAIANLRTFKAAQATQKCPYDITTFKKVITSIEITSNNNYDTLFNAGDTINSLFKIQFTKKININGGTEIDYYENPDNYYFTRKKTLATIELKNTIDSIDIHDIYFKYIFDNNEIHMDTLVNQNLGWGEY